MFFFRKIDNNNDIQINNNKIIDDKYYNPETGYCGINQLKRKTKLKQKDIEDFLHQQDVYTRFKPVIRKFRRRKVYVPNSNHQFDADLLFIKKYSKYNDGINYLLTVIDAFNKYAWVFPIKRKSSEHVIEGFKQIFKERIPKFLCSDEGLEFTGSKTQQLLKEYNIHWFTTYNKEIKSSIAERFNKTIKDKIIKYMYANQTKRYIDVLPKLVYNYNNSYHRSIKMTPTEASKEENESKVYKNLYSSTSFKKKPKFKVGDKVRISKIKTTFMRGYDPTFTTEVFTVSEVLDTDPVTYKLDDLIGSFYENEMVKINSDINDA